MTTPYDPLQELIDKQDTVEIVRDQIARILANESANQMQLALSSGKSPEPWLFLTTVDRANAYEQALNNPKDPKNRTPIVNVWFRSGDFDKSSSNVVSRQAMNARFVVDCYGFGITKDIPGGGHLPGDEDASNECHRIMRLVRNILMASKNTYLQLQGLVWERWVLTQELFQPRFDNQHGLQVVGGRIIFECKFNEFAPQFVAPELEGINVDIKRSEDGFLLAEADFDYATQ